MKKTDVLVIGGSAAGLVTAVTARSHNPGVTVTVIRKEKEVLVPCGIPYIFGSLAGSAQNIIPDAKLENAGVDLIVDEVTAFDSKAKQCTTKSGETINFTKAVFATGSVPKKPAWLKGADLKNVFTVPKEKAYIDKLNEQVKTTAKVVVIGGGFIGVEVSDELNKAGRDVTIVEMLPHVLGAVFDDAAAEKAEATVKARGVKVMAGAGVKEISGSGKVEKVILQNGESLSADAVVLAMGYEPNTELARRSGLKLNEFNQIRVDEYMRTENIDIFAVGDCAQKRNFITRRNTCTMLASTACAEARIAGINLLELSATKSFNGTIALFSTAIGDQAFAVAGLTAGEAQKQNLSFITGSFAGPDKHPGKLPGMKMQSVELIVARDSGLILGGTIIGGKSAGEVVNIIGLAIQNHMTVYDMLTIQIGTHPLLTAPPTAYPLVKAAEAAVKALKSSK
ncbi:MAG TPA: FAD-dependent oxidoreductase [Spirochaetota bacterium]|nr:FAD-dependent oxidoreductase [Spirochaetota bacterium]